jgi:putative membrane-bound dehydrogenase-like protein
MHRTGSNLGRLVGCVVLFTAIGSVQSGGSSGDVSVASPLSPQAELATFRLPKGFRAELVACEPDVIDPVAMAFDENGRLFVAEMRGYPNRGVATGRITSGRIKLLEDRDGDGYYEHCTIFADNLRFPTSVMPWKGGLIAAVAPDIVFFEDTDGDGKADRKRTLYTDFNLENIQQLVNSLQWGLDNWVYGCGGYNGGTVRSAEKPDMAAVTLKGRGIRFHPDLPGSLEPTSGGGQFGLAPDAWERWFTATNNQHLRHIVLPDHYLRRNSFLSVPEVALDIPDHGAACKVYRISPFEPWRVERTRRRREGPDSQRFPSTELVAGGYITSACSPVVYEAALFPEEYRGNTFVCDPANNVVHRDILVGNGATFVARRAEPDHEFLASTDTWFRPVNLTIGPDGALYVLDFYREAIENPVSLPEDIKRTLNLESRGRGRIWRILPEGPTPRPKVALAKMKAEGLVKHLDDANMWWRLTAQRLLVERQDGSAIPALVKMAAAATHREGRAHALWTLDALNALDEGLIERALGDPDPELREQALRLADRRLQSSRRLQLVVAALADDPSPRVRFQLALTLGQADVPTFVSALAKIAMRDAADPWTQLAVLSSASRSAPALLDMLLHDHEFVNSAGAGRTKFASQLGALVGASGNDDSLVQSLRLLQGLKNLGDAWRIAVLGGMGEGRQNSRRPLASLWSEPASPARAALEAVRPLFENAAATARDGQAAVGERVSAARLLAYGPPTLALETLKGLLDPQAPPQLQLAAVRALSLQVHPDVAAGLLAQWKTYSPTLRREVIEALFAREDRLGQLLDAMAHNRVPPGQLEPARLDRLRKHPNQELRERGRSILGRLGVSDRRNVLTAYRAALDLPADHLRGKAVFKKTCATCHRLENEGTEVGPDLLSALRNKTRETLLTDILDPSREVDPRYVDYIVTNKAGRVFTGMIAAETASSITLRRAEKAEDVLLRTDVDTMQATAKSLMPEGLEMQLGKQDVADLIAYLQSVAGPR